MIADRRLYHTADRSRVVEEGDPDAAFLLVAVGQPMPDGLDVPTPEPTPEPKPPVDEPSADEIEHEPKAKPGRKPRKPD